MLPDLRLLPWEFAGSGAALSAHAQARHSFDGREREFLLKSHEDRLFFCELDEDAPLYAVTTSFAGENRKEFWRRAIERGEFGQVHRFSMWFKGSDASTSLVAIVKAEQCGWIREWCGGEWFSFSQSEIDQIRQSSPGLPITNVCAKIVALHPQAFVERSQPDSERINQPFHWVAGSHQEAQEVIHACMILFGDPPGRIPWMQETAHIRPHSAIAVGRIDYECVPTFWLELLSKHLVAVGWRWSRYQAVEASLRGGWKLSVPYQSISVPFVERPSMHEKMEAGLFLRGWLQGKISPAEIEKLLP